MTPARPDHRYGNMIVLSDPLQLGALEGWYRRYEELHAIATLPSAPCIAWETRDNAQLISYETEAHARGSDLFVAEVLVYDRNKRLDRVTNKEFRARPIENDSEWAEAAAMATPADGFAENGLRAWLLEQRRKLVDRGEGTWWGGWVNDRLVTSCGSFHGDNIARLEQLLVAQNERRRGYGSALIAEITLQTAAEYRFVVMEPAYQDWRTEMYRRLGYERVGLTLTVVAIGDTLQRAVDLAFAP
jgi:GNAT superfamily N-acetyltransferase